MYNLNSLSPTEVKPPLLKFSKQPREFSPSLSYRSCAAAFPTGYGPRGDAFAVDHKWATSTLLIVTLKGKIDSGPTVAIKYKLSACTLIWLFGIF